MFKSFFINIGCAKTAVGFRLSVMLSPPKPLDDNQPYLVCELLT